VSGPKRRPCEDGFTGTLSPDWVVAFIVIALLVAGALGFWFDAIYRSGTGVFAP
jgi:ABC-type transporter Mla subunit MlaD